MKKNKSREPFKFLKNANIRTQLYSIYILAVFIPVLLIGTFLIINTGNLLTSYHRDLLESDNLRVKTILFEITTQVYNISEEVSFDSNVQSILTRKYPSRDAQVKVINSTSTSLDNYMYNYSEIDQIEIYSDNPYMMEYKQYHPVTQAIAEEDWYQKAVEQSSVFWVEMVSYDKYNNEYWNLCLVRKIPLVNSDYHAVLVIRVSDNYLNTRVSSQEYQMCASVDEGRIFYATSKDDYGQQQVVGIDYDENYFRYAGSLKLHNKTCFVDVSTLHLYQSDSRIYICTLNDKSYDNIKNIIYICMAIIAVAIVIPAILIYFFTGYFTGRVLTLRQVMHQASNEDYDFEEVVQGNDELSEAFADLEIMVQNIKQKDEQMYEAQINEKELVNEQQKMEFKMLASQINPHFLYNTLESIRMKAFTVGDREVANAIKLLGKSMRYVLENNGTTFTALKNELNHIETYIMIQKMRFGDKFNYELCVDDDIDTEQCRILPLLQQPIVENALVHGLEEKEEGGMITLQVERCGGSEDIRITISDNGCGMDEATLAQLRRDIEEKNPERKESIGLYNINQRIKLCYGEQYGMAVQSELEKGTAVSITISMKTQQFV